MPAAAIWAHTLHGIPPRHGENPQAARLAGDVDMQYGGGGPRDVQRMSSAPAAVSAMAVALALEVMLLGTDVVRSLVQATVQIQPFVTAEMAVGQVAALHLLDLALVA